MAPAPSGPAKLGRHADRGDAQAFEDSDAQVWERLDGLPDLDDKHLVAAAVVGATEAIR